MKLNKSMKEMKMTQHDSLLRMIHYCRKGIWSFSSAFMQMHSVDLACCAATQHTAFWKKQKKKTKRYKRRARGRISWGISLAPFKHKPQHNLARCRFSVYENCGLKMCDSSRNSNLGQTSPPATRVPHLLQTCSNTSNYFCCKCV